MNKSETRELAKIQQYRAAGLGADYVARALSALYRASRSTQSKLEILAAATQYGVTDHPEFIC
jgi:hypothetical protein